MGQRSASRRYERLDDTRLAALVRKGDAGAFEAIYDRHPVSYTHLTLPTTPYV